jgi:CHAT domain-containing protein
MDERRAVVAHLAGCADCRHVLVETMELLAGDSTAHAVPAAAPRVVPFSRRRWLTAGSALAAAAAVVFAIRFWGTGGGEFSRPELQALAAALAAEPTRPLEARLAGGYAYGPPPEITRGGVERSVSPDVQIAAANIEKQATSDESAPARAALAVARLVRHDPDGAIDALLEAAQIDPRNAAYQTDLSAAYLARARSQAGSEADWAAALAAANRALAIADSHEARFNRALALEGAHLREQAIAAWTDYRARDSGSPWSTEAASHLRALVQTPQPGAALPLDTLPMRERIEHVLLREWGAAIMAGDAETARQRLSEAESAANELVASGGDGMAQDAIRLIRQAQAHGSQKTVAEFAIGHELYGRARAALLNDEQQTAADLMTTAARHLRLAGSPYADWEPVLRAILLRNQGQSSAALEQLALVPLRTLPASYTHLRARVEWGQGVALDEQGRYDIGFRHLARAVDLFSRTTERANLAATRTILAEAEWVLGDHRAAWKDVFAVLQDVERGGLKPSYYHLAIAGRLALSAGLPEAAIEFETARVEAVSSPRTQAEAYMRRARTYALLGGFTAAASDLEHAAAAVDRLPDEALRVRNAADVSISRAELFSRTDSRRAIEAANAAMRTVPALDPAVRLARLLALRARAHAAAGDVPAARADLLASIAEFEAKRANFTSVEDRLRAFDGERPVFRQLIELEAIDAGDSAAARRIAERARAGAWRLQDSAAVVDPGAEYHRLPHDTAVVLFEVLDSQTLVWTITDEGISYFTRPLAASALTVAAERIDRAVAAGAASHALMPAAGPIMRELIGPALKAAGDRPVVFIIPDGPLARLPFPALPDESGQPLINTRAIAIGGSVTDLLAGMSRLADFAPTSVLAVGDGHDAETTGLPMLPRADAEAAAVGALYPRSLVAGGGLATRERLLADSADVLHFAGHTVVNREFPLLSRLLVAPARGGQGDGALLASQILTHRFDRTRVAVLATCDGGAGAVIDGEGVVSVARAFLSAGVPAVIASLWPVDDDTHGLMTTFHRELQAGHRPVQALRAAQLGMLRSLGPNTAVRAWGGFTAFGGMTAG